MTNKGTAALRQFTLFKGKSGGRNSQGRITAFHRGGGAKRLLRRIDPKRSNPGVGIVERIEYDPNRSSKIALVRWVEGAIPPRRHKEECDAAVDEELASLRNKMMGPATVSKDGGGRFSFSSLSGKMNRTRTQDIFSSALSSSPKTTAQGMAVSSLPFGLGLPRIALAGAKPTFFASRVRHEPSGGSCSLSEIREWRPDRDIWAHRMKRKAAVSWRSLRQHSTLGVVVAACHDEAKWKEDHDQRHAFLVKVASIREVVLGAPLKAVLKHLLVRTVAPDVDRFVALVHRPKESFLVIPQEFVEARRTAGLSNMPRTWSLSPPLELKGAPAQALVANAGFVMFGIFPWHVEGGKLDRTAWSLSTFHAYVSYHVKVSGDFMEP